MVIRSDGREGKVARVEPDLCVSCGICAGSCAPMGVGPPQRTGRDQIAEVRRFLASRELGPEDVVVVACERGAGGVSRLDGFQGAAVLPVTCAGSLHTSVIELLVRAGVGGVLVVTCPPRDCWSREGVKWLGQRVYHEREAELQARVDRTRLRLVHASAAERGQVAEELEAFWAHVLGLERAPRQEPTSLERECDTEPASGKGAPS